MHLDQHSQQEQCKFQGQCNLHRVTDQWEALGPNLDQMICQPIACRCKLDQVIGYKQVFQEMTEE